MTTISGWKSHKNQSFYSLQSSLTVFFCIFNHELGVASSLFVSFLCFFEIFPGKKSWADQNFICKDLKTWVFRSKSVPFTWNTCIPTSTLHLSCQKMLRLWTGRLPYAETQSRANVQDLTANIITSHPHQVQQAQQHELR